VSDAKLHVAVDLDDVVVDFMAGVMHSFELEYGVRPEWDGRPWGDSAVEFTMHELFKESGYKNWWGWLRDREWLWAQFQAVPGAIGGVKRLRAAGCYMEAVTSKPDWAEHNVWKWLGKWRPPFNRVTVINSTNGDRKVDFTPADVMVDDKLQTCEEFIDAGRYAVHFDRSGVESRSGELWTVTDWQQAVAAVLTLMEV